MSEHEKKDYDPLKIRKELLEQGKHVAQKFCTLNKLKLPNIRVVPQSEWRFKAACAYYRPTYIAICVEECATLGKAGRSWSWPGNAVDRTPYGVIQHELGHHVDHKLSTDKGSYFGYYSKNLRKLSGEEPLTGYCPNDAEWFAEIFRLFVTNSDLLRLIRPKAYAALIKVLNPVVTDPWRTVLTTAPARTREACAARVVKAEAVTKREKKESLCLFT